MEEEEDQILATRTAAHWGEGKLGDAKPKARLYPPATHSLGFGLEMDLGEPQNDWFCLGKLEVDLKKLGFA